MKDCSKNHFLAEATLLLIICQNVRKLCINFCSNIELNSRPWCFCRSLQASFYVDSMSCTGFFFFQSEFSSTMLDQPTAALPRRTYNSVFIATMTPRDYRGLFSSLQLIVALSAKAICMRGVAKVKILLVPARPAAIVVLLLRPQPTLPLLRIQPQPILPILPVQQQASVAVPLPRPLLPKALLLRPSVVAQPRPQHHLLQARTTTMLLKWSLHQCLEPMPRSYQPSLLPPICFPSHPTRSTTAIWLTLCSFSTPNPTSPRRPYSIQGLLLPFVPSMLCSGSRRVPMV